MERSSIPAAPTAGATARTRASRALRRSQNWIQLGKFCVVGAAGYAINLGVYALLLNGFGIHYLAAAVCSFLVAVTNNYLWNRVWTFRGQRGHVAYQGMRFFAVALVALSANVLILRLLVAAGLGKLLGQAAAIVLVTPLNFIGNKLWSFSTKSATQRGNGPPPG